MAHPPVGVRTEYLLDAGRSHTIGAALQPVLAEIRTLLGASVGLVGYRPRTAEADLLMLAVGQTGVRPRVPEPARDVVRRLGGTCAGRSPRVGGSAPSRSTGICSGR